MVQGKEIRIGNYLKDRSGKILRVDFIEYVENGFDTKFGQKMFVEGQEVHRITEYSDYANPIELSGEWLEKLGFDLVVKEGNQGEFRIYQLNEITYNTNHGWWWKHQLTVQPKYVHELQNLFFAITGTELELKTDV